MAMTAESLRGPLHFSIDLKSGLVQQPIRAQLMKGDRRANTVVITLTDDKAPADLSGAAATGSFISPVDGAEIPLTGSVNGNEVQVTLIDECYAADGYFECHIKLTVGETSRTILSFTGYVLSRGSGAVIDIGNVIPSIDDIIAQYEKMQQVTKSAQDAADAANAAAEHAPYIDEGSNHWMAWDKETGKYVDTGVEATGPKGEAGNTPYIGSNGNWWVGDVDTGTKAQGPAGANGTGSGTVTGIKVNDQTYMPDQTGVVELPEMGGSDVELSNAAPQPLGADPSPGTGTLAAREDHVHKMPSASDVGALPANGTAENSDKLGGKTPAAYTSYKNLADNSDFQHWVAQAGIGEKHGNQAYGGDRWMLTSGSITGKENADSDGYSNITLNGTLVQVVPSPPKTATPFIEMVSGTAEISYDATVGEIIITSAGGVIKNVLLLDGVWADAPEYVSAGYAVELAKCQIYYRYIATLALETDSAGRWMMFNCQYSVRITPTITIDKFTDSAGTEKEIVVEQVSCDKTCMWMIRASQESYSTVRYAYGIRICADLTRRAAA